MDRQQPTTGQNGLPQALGRLRVALENAYLQASRDRGLTPQQAELLCAALKPRSIGELAYRLRCDRSNVSRLVDRAANRGLLYRHGENRDGRVAVIELTPDGRRLAEEFIRTLESFTEPLRSDWSYKREQATVKTLNVLSNTLESALEPRGPETDEGLAEDTTSRLA